MSWFRRLRALVVQRILGLEDTPHRIAWGVFLGFVVAFTPTVGVQMVLYVTVATLLRANKLAGLPVVWISNPATMLPIYYFCWRVGAYVLGTDDDPERTAMIVESLIGGVGFTWMRILETGFWVELGRTLWSIGGELWLGGILVGGVLGAPFYPLTRWGVVSYRNNRDQMAARVKALQAAAAAKAAPKDGEDRRNRPSRPPLGPVTPQV